MLSLRRLGGIFKYWLNFSAFVRASRAINYFHRRTLIYIMNISSSNAISEYWIKFVNNQKCWKSQRLFWIAKTFSFEFSIFPLNGKLFNLLRETINISLTAIQSWRSIKREIYHRLSSNRMRILNCVLNRCTTDVPRERKSQKKYKGKLFLSALSRFLKQFDIIYGFCLRDEWNFPQKWKPISTFCVVKFYEFSQKFRFNFTWKLKLKCRSKEIPLSCCISLAATIPSRISISIHKHFAIMKTNHSLWKINEYISESMLHTK